MSQTQGIRIGRILGIPIYLDFSWILIFGLVTLSLGSQFKQEFPQWSTTEQWGAGILTSVLFFASVVFHELAHSAVFPLRAAVRCRRPRARAAGPRLPRRAGCRSPAAFSAPPNHGSRARRSHSPQSICPPSTAMFWPVTQSASGEHRNSATCATSSGRPSRPNGMLLRMRP